MKNLKFIFVAIAFIAVFTQSHKANASNLSIVNYTTNGAITFVENGITFSVFKNGEFDFYLNSISNGLNVNYQSSNVNISFNSGYNYDPYVQYDTYGAVIQVENTPVYYDQYGRIQQIGSININYNGNVVYRVGGLFMHYNTHGYYTHHTGYINHYNRHYVYHPHHNWFVRPYVGYTGVRTAPYRYNYRPHRYHYSNGHHHHAYKHKHGHHNNHYKKRKMHHKHSVKQKGHASHDYRRKTATTYRTRAPHKKQASNYKNTHYTSKKRNTVMSNTTKRNSVYNSRTNTQTYKRKPNNVAKTTVAKKRPSTINRSRTAKPNRTKVVQSNSSRQNYKKVNSVMNKRPSRSIQAPTHKKYASKKNTTSRRIKGRS